MPRFEVQLARNETRSIMYSSYTTVEVEADTPEIAREIAAAGAADEA